LEVSRIRIPTPDTRTPGLNQIRIGRDLRCRMLLSNSVLNDVVLYEPHDQASLNLLEQILPFFVKSLFGTTDNKIRLLRLQLLTLS